MIKVARVLLAFLIPMTISLRNVGTLFLLLTITAGCKIFEQVQKKVEETQKPKVITSEDGKCQLTVPGSWSVRKDLNEEASIQVANLFAEQYTVVIADSKADFTDDVGLGGYAEMIRKGATNAIQTPIVSEDRSLLVNGYPALQFEVSGSIESVKARWIYTVIDAPKGYYQIVAWTLHSKYEANKPVLLEVSSSFRENEDSISPPPPPPPASAPPQAKP